jgi:hypothetical protein
VTSACSQARATARSPNHNHDVGKVVVIVSFVGINTEEFKNLIKIVNYFIFM